MSIDIELMQDRILVERMETTDVTASGLYIPDSAKEKPCEGKVVAIGKGKIAENGVRIPLTVTVGVTVLFNKYAGTEITYKGTEYLVIREDDIIAIVK